MLTVVNKELIIKYVKALYITICALLILASCLAIIFPQVYVFYNTDDFIGLKSIEKTSSMSLLEYWIHSLKGSFEAWRDWQGAYGGVFWAPLIRATYMSHDELVIVRIVLIVTFFLMASAYLIHIIERLSHNRLQQLTFLTTTMWSFINYKSFYQVFFWPNVITLYMMSFGCLMLALYFMYRMIDTDKTIYCVLACIFAVVAMGGTQIIVFSGCYLAMVELIGDIYEKRFDRKELIVFLTFVLFGMLNVFAPGHFNRHSYIETGGKLHIFKALGWAIKDDFIYSEEYFKDTGFLTICLIMMLVAFILDSPVIRKVSIIRLILFAFVPIVTLYPACLGYSSSYMQNRIRFVVEFWIVVRFLLLSVVVGCALRKIVDYKNKSIITIGVGLAICLSLFLSDWRFEDGQVYKLLSAVANGELRDYKSAVDGILREIEDSSEEDVITADLPETIDGFIPFYYTDDPNYYGNINVRAYYGKNSVRARGEREYTPE